VIQFVGELEYRKLAAHNPQLWMQALVTHPATAVVAAQITDRLHLFMQGFYSCAGPNVETDE
jgi:hypothetical protein